MSRKELEYLVQKAADKIEREIVETNALGFQCGAPRSQCEGAAKKVVNMMREYFFQHNRPLVESAQHKSS